MNGRTNTTSVTEVIEGVQVPLEAPTNLVLTPLNARVDITWTDPVDKFAAPDGQTATNPWDNVATWDHSIVVRKANSAPTSPSDGELIYTETTRNQHQYTAYSDTNNVVNNTVYYYAVYAITAMDAVSEPIVDSCKPIEGTPEYIRTENITAISTQYYPYLSATIGNYMLFKCRYDNNPNISYNSLMLAIDNSLTQSAPENAINNYQENFFTQTDEYAFLAGGYYIDGGNNSYYSTDQVCVYNKSLVLQTLPESLSQAWSIAGGACGFNKYAIFAAGSVGGDYISSLNAFDNSLTRVLTSNASVRGYTSGASISDYGIFAGGDQVVGYSYGNDVNKSSTSVEAYDTSLTKVSSIQQLSTGRTKIVSATLDNRAVFMDGYVYDDDDGDKFNDYYYHGIDIYDSSLTRTSGPELFPAETDEFVSINTAVALGSYILYYGYFLGLGAIKMIDSSFTIINDVKNLPDNYPNANAYTSSSIDNYALISRENGHKNYIFDLYEAK